MKPRAHRCFLLSALVAFTAGCGPKASEQPPEGSTSSGTSSGTTSGTTSVPTTGTLDGTTFCPNSCGEAVVDIPIVTPSVMLVLDKSGSMVADPGGFWDHDQEPNTLEITRWNSLYSVIDATVDRYEGVMDLGAVLFPSTAATSSYDEGACVVGAQVDVPIAAMNAAAVLAALPGALSNGVTIRGATPTTLGLERAIQELTGAPPDRPRVMILVTDGAANCQKDAPDAATLLEVYDSEVEQTVAAALAMGITTYVVGLEISQAPSDGTKDGNPDDISTHEKLNLLAQAGGAALPGEEKFFHATDQIALQSAMDTIAMQLLSCTIDLDPAPPYPDFIEISPYEAAQVTDCATEDGWQFIPGDPPQVQLCGKACLDFQTSGHVAVQYRCPTGPDAPC